jgi:hypothetical protein
MPWAVSRKFKVTAHCLPLTRVSSKQWVVSRKFKLPANRPPPTKKESSALQPSVLNSHFHFPIFAFRFFVLLDRKHRPVSARIGFGTAGAGPTGQGRQLGPAIRNLIYFMI